MAHLAVTPLRCVSSLSGRQSAIFKGNKPSLLAAFLVTMALTNPVPGESQNSKPSSAGSRVASHTLIPSGHEQFAPYWTTESGWRTELQLRNNLAAGNLTVTPVLGAADGSEFPLSPVEGEKLGAADCSETHDNASKLSARDGSKGRTDWCLRRV